MQLSISTSPLTKRKITHSLPVKKPLSIPRMHRTSRSNAVQVNAFGKLQEPTKQLENAYSRGIEAIRKDINVSDPLVDPINKLATVSALAFMASWLASPLFPPASIFVPTKVAQATFCLLHSAIAASHLHHKLRPGSYANMDEDGIEKIIVSGIEYHKEGNIKEAKKWLDHAVKYDEIKNWDVGEALMKVGGYELAIEYLKDAYVSADFYKDRAGGNPYAREMAYANAKKHNNAIDSLVYECEQKLTGKH